MNRGTDALTSIIVFATAAYICWGIENPYFWPATFALHQLFLLGDKE